MQIVIDIDENDFIEVTQDYYSGTPFENRIFYAVANGIPLPKGHGRLVDADVVKDKMGNLDGFGFIGRCVDEIPTVLEVDKEI